MGQIRTADVIAGRHSKRAKCLRCGTTRAAYNLKYIEHKIMVCASCYKKWAKRQRYKANKKKRKAE